MALATFLAVVLIVAPDASADHTPLTGDLSLVWDAPASCPSAEDVERRTRGELPAGTRPSARVRAFGRVEETNDGRWTLHLQIDAAAGRLTPETTAADCDVLADAAAVQIAMALEPVVVPAGSEVDATVSERTDASDPAPSHPPTPAEPEPPAPTPEAPPEAVSSSRPAVTGVLASGVGVGIGIVPDLDVSLILAGGVLVPLPTRAFRSVVRVELLVGHVLARTRAAPDGTPAGVRVSAWSVGPRGCWEPTAASVLRPGANFSFPLCLGVDVVAVTGRGEGVRRSYRATRPAVDVVAGAHAIWHPLPRLGLRLGVESWVTAARPAFDIDDTAPLYTVDLFGVRGLFALQASLP